VDRFHLALVGDCGEHGNEPAGTMNGEKFLDKLSSYQVLKKDSDLWNDLL
jgi:hypothetical protein